MSAESVTEPVDFVTGAPTSSGSLQVSWHHGVRPGSADVEPARWPDEPPLQMAVAQLGDIRDAAVAVADSPGAHSFDDFAILNGS
jgi:hypothetical protein